MQLKFRKWVDEFGGIKKVALALDVGEHQVRAWLRGENVPRPLTIEKMIKLSKGSLTFEIICKETSRGRK